jgi:hypothetical protein
LEEIDQCQCQGRAKIKLFKLWHFEEAKKRARKQKMPFLSILPEGIFCRY